jgi:uncharacterized protein (DUF1330 family)
MTAYVAAQFTIHDQERYLRYARAFAATMEGYDGELLAADVAPERLEGEWPHRKFVLIRFRDAEEARRWASSPAYQEISKDRVAATVGTTLLVRGVDAGA